MSDEELLKTLKDGGQVSVPYFDGALLPVDLGGMDAAEAMPALKSFLMLSADNRRSDARHLVAYCKLMMRAVGEEEILSSIDGKPPTLETIWDYASPGLIFFGKLDAGEYAPAPTIFLQIEGNVAWEREHGLQMSWAGGRRLAKVSAFDGHPTNGHTSANRGKDQHVFSCYLPDLCTLPDPD